jgi:DNA-binding Xre family transcriptional regulator
MNDRLLDAILPRMKELGISKNELSKRTGVSFNNIIYMTTGRNKNTRIGTIERVYDALGLDIKIVTKNE